MESFVDDIPGLILHGIWHMYGLNSFTTYPI